MVGRARERAEIADAFHDAASARRQVMFVSGEAGIGKTTLVDSALADRRRATGPPPLIGRDQCIEQYPERPHAVGAEPDAGVVDLGLNSGPHCLTLTSDEDRLVVSDYFLVEDLVPSGVINAEGDMKIHVQRTAPPRVTTLGGSEILDSAPVRRQRWG